VGATARDTTRGRGIDTTNKQHDAACQKKDTNHFKWDRVDTNEISINFPLEMHLCRRLI